MSWKTKRKNEPSTMDMPASRCEQGGPLFDHEPHTWFIEREPEIDIERDGNRVTRTKVESIDWFWCRGWTD